jgi:hypothetical protein
VKIKVLVADAVADHFRNDASEVSTRLRIEVHDVELRFHGRADLAPKLALLLRRPAHHRNVSLTGDRVGDATTEGS